jgi:hypothetical protein
MNGTRRPSTPPQHVASCVFCRRALCTAGKNRKYLRCRICKYNVRREGIIKNYVMNEHLADCLGCRHRMSIQRNKENIISFYCEHCKLAVRHFYRRIPPVLDKELYNLIEAVVPKNLYWEIREAVCTDVLIAVLKTRRAKNGYGLMPNELRFNPEKIQPIIKKVSKFHNEKYKNYSLDHPLTEDGFTFLDILEG